MAALTLAVVLSGVVVETSSAQAQTYQESTLFTFADCSMEGCYANQSLIRDAAGNLYGTNERGGPNNSLGTVFKLDTSDMLTVLYAFTGNTDGWIPNPGLVMDKAGNLYGTTQQGGAGSCFGGCGAVFKVNKDGKETVLYSFGGGKDGMIPMAGVVMDAVGNLYGTTLAGGDQRSYGTVFKISKSGKETVLHRFTGGGDGGSPYGSLILDDEENLYGTTSAGGTGCSGGCGTVFMMNKTGRETVLHRFHGRDDGDAPFDSLVRDTKGNLYGTTVGGGTYGFGTVFKVSKVGKEVILYSFPGTNDDGYPYSGLVRDKAGNLYGATYYGGMNNCNDESGYSGCGTIFKVDPSGKGTLLYSFTGGTDGAYPSYGNLLLDASGNLYGATYGDPGDDSGASLVFKLTP
jgi:uncharacterized repeat protein (TIGR03803 family)